ncbi:MAG: hypothetical protein ACI814_004003, partial [Mariniblastus sp.]
MINNFLENFIGDPKKPTENAGSLRLAFSHDMATRCVNAC